MKISLLVLLICSVLKTEACSCRDQGEHHKFCTSDFVIRASVTSAARHVDGQLLAEWLEEQNYDGYYHGDVKYDIRIHKVYRGEAEIDKDADNQYIWTSNDSGLCGYKFRVGQEYIIFGYTKDNELRTNSCSVNKLARGADMNSLTKYSCDGQVTEKSDGGAPKIEVEETPEFVLPELR